MAALRDWRDDTFDVLRTKASRIVGILIVAFVLTRPLKVASRHFSGLRNRHDLPSAVLAQQIRTLSSVIYSVGVWPAPASQASPSASARRHW